MLTALTPSRPVEVFISYAHKDEELRDQLAKFLAILVHQNLIAPWHGRQIMPGEDWEEKIDTHLNSAQMILLLVSTDFLASRYCYGVEFKRAMERREAGEACVIPVILRPCEWKESPMRKLQALPRDGKPVVKWDRRDDAFLNVAEGIRHAIKRLTKPETLADMEVTKPVPSQDSSPAPSASVRPLPRILVWGFLLLTAAASFWLLAGLISSWSRPTEGNVNSPGPSSMSAQGVRLTLTEVPPYDPNGSVTPNAHIAGKVEAARPEDYRVVIYSLTNMWYVQPTTANSKIAIDSDGTWSANIQTGSRYAILLVVPDFQPPFITTSKPADLIGVVTSIEVEGEKRNEK